MQSTLSKRSKWKDRAYREAYMEASIEQGIAWQIRINRKLRHMTQGELAAVLGTQQSAISRLEDPTYGAHSLDTLKSIAKCFDCALSVKFVAYSQLAFESEKLGEAEQYAAPYLLEMKELHEQQENFHNAVAPAVGQSTLEHFRRPAISHSSGAVRHKVHAGCD